MTNQKISELIDLIANNQISALEELYQIFSKSVFFFALSYVKNIQTAEDIMQETFLSVAEKADMFKYNSSPKAWILQIAKNLCFNKIKREKIEQKYISELNKENSYVEELENRINFTMLLKRLTYEEKNIVVQKIEYDLTYKELSRLTGKSERTLKRIYKNILEKCNFLLIE